ncbi:MAG: hypothetical protein JOZ82_05025 [Marmoricola sp.]|nr:hypothetical protein [Marmoricola sp.]
MTHDEPEPQPTLDPQQEEQVRALLAGLGPGADDAAMPADVADRLDETLAALVAEREAARLSTEHTATGQVVPLRPRWMPRLAAAAAVVVVLGLGGIVAASVGHHDDHSASSTSGAAAQSRPSPAGPSAPAASGPASSATGAESAAPPRLTTAHFAQGVASLLGGTPAGRSPARLKADDKAATGAPSPAAPRPLAAGCSPPRVTDGSQVSSVLVDGRPAALVVHPPTPGGRLVEAWSCDGAHRLAFTTLAP